MIIDYNKTKLVPDFDLEHRIFRFGIDIFDEDIGRYAYRPATNRWPLVVFHFMLNSSARNAFVVCKPNTSQRSFLNALSMALMEPQKREKSSSGHWITKKLAQISGLYENLLSKISGRDQSPYTNCHICNKVGRFGPKTSF